MWATSISSGTMGGRSLRFSLQKLRNLSSRWPFPWNTEHTYRSLVALLLQIITSDLMVIHTMWELQDGFVMLSNLAQGWFCCNEIGDGILQWFNHMLLGCQYMLRETVSLQCPLQSHDEGSLLVVISVWYGDAAGSQVRPTGHGVVIVHDIVSLR